MTTTPKGVMIKGMDIPKDCSECKFYTFEVGIMHPYCLITNDIIKDSKQKFKKCPLQGVT